MIERQLALDAPLLEQKEQRLVQDLTPGIVITGDASLLGRVAGNLLSNASLYSPEGAEVRVWCGLLDGSPALTVENTGARISEDACRICSRPSTGKRVPGTGLPAAAAGAVSGENDFSPTWGGMYHRKYRGRGAGCGAV